MTSKKGACSSNTQPAKANCLAHNRREGHTPSYVNPHLTHLNRTVFEDAAVSGRKSIVPLVKRAEKDYTAKTGQKCQKSFTPFRESCLVVRAGTTDAQLMAFKEKAERLLGWRCLGIWMHLDEGHAKSRYIEGEDGFATNSHAHVLWDCIDHATGKAVRPTRSAFSRMQDLLAESTGMERGNKAKDTGRTRRSASEQRIHSLEQRITQLEQEAAAREQRIEAASGKAKEIGAAAIEGLHSLLQPGKAKQERAEEIAAARADERAKVINEIQQAAGLTLRDATSQGIGKLWGSSHRKAEELAKKSQDLQTQNRELKDKAEKAEKEADGWRKDWGKAVNEKSEAMDKVKEQAEELEAWRSGLIGRALDAIARYVMNLVYRLSPKERDDIAQAAAKITPHGLYLLATAQLPVDSAKRAENAISSAINGDAEKVETNSIKASEDNEKMIRLNVDGIEIEISQIARDFLADEVSKFDVRTVETAERITNAAILLAINYINEATTLAESHGGGGGGDMTGWGRKKDEDDEAWLRRCATTAHSLFLPPKPKYKIKR